jgi:hypothetical protein
VLPEVIIGFTLAMIFKRQLTQGFSFLLLQIKPVGLHLYFTEEK